MSFIFLLLLLLPSIVYSTVINSASCSQSDVQSAINSAVDGDTVTIPACAATGWATGITISGKGITLTGAGSGRIVGRSTSSVTVGTGTKVFTTQSGLSISAGQTLRIFWLADTSGWPGSNPNGRSTYMEGTVSSYSGTTLTMSISSTGGSGTHADWLIGTTSATTIVNNASGALIAITTDASHYTNVGHFKVAAGSGGAHKFEISGSLSNKIVIVHDMWIEQSGSGDVFRMHTSRGLFYNLSVDAAPFEDAELGWHVLADGETSSWESASTWGAADTTGERNIYIEDSDIHNFLHFSDFDNNARATLRHNLFHQAAIGSHGQDTSDYGVRQIEVHDNVFLAANESGGYPLNYWLLQRGGTGVWTDNDVPDIRPSDGKVELMFGIYVLRESVSNDPCWGEDIPGAQYPAPRQIGFGYVTGTGVDGLGNSTYLGVYVGDSEPFYYWNNTGITTPAIGVDDTSDGGCVGSLDSGADYFQSGRDYFINAGAKPGYSKKTYPHPLRAVSYVLTVTFSGTGSGTVTSSPTGINCTATCNASFDESTVVTLSASASDGGSFTGWSGEGCSGTGTCQVTMSVARSVTAAFAAAPISCTYYIDNTAGNDANDGTSPATAWQRSPGMAAYTGSGVLVAGDTVCFDSADTWLVTGNQGLYLVGGVTYVGNNFGAGPRAIIRANADLGTAVVRFRDHATVETVFRGFEVDGNSKVTNGIEMNVAQAASALTGAVKRIDRVLVHHNYSQASLGTYTYGIGVSNHVGAGGEVANVEILNSEVHSTSRDALVLYPGDENTNCIIRNILVRGNVVHNTSLDPTYDYGAAIAVKGRVIDAVIEYNYVYDADGSTIFVNGNETNHFGTGMTGIHIRYNIIDKSNTSTQASLLIYDTGTGDPKEVKVYGNIFLPSTGTIGGLYKDNTNTITLDVYNNTFYESWVDFTDISDTPTVNFKNNLIYYTGGVPFSVEAAGVASHSNNIYYRGSGVLVTVGATTYTAATLSTYEATGLSTQPLFVDTASLPTGFSGSAGSYTPNTPGLSMQQGSNAVNAGVALAATYQSSVNSLTRPQGAAWDIGAYELSGGVVKSILKIIK